MDLRNIMTVKTILAEGSFRKAAERLNYTQSTVTFQIRQLESELSLKLFERIGRRMVLTQSGKDILPQFDIILRALEEIRCLGEKESEPSGELRIAVAESLLLYRMQPVLGAFVKQAPKVRLTLHSLNCYDIKDALIAGETDIGIYFNVGGHLHTLDVVGLSDFECILVSSPKLSPRHRDFDTPNREKDASFVTNEPHSIYREMMEHFIKSKNIMLRNTIELWSVEAVKKSVASNLGFSFLPRFTVEKELKDRLLVEIPVTMQHRVITAVCAHHRNKALTRGMRLFKKILMESKAFREKQ